MSAGSPQRSVVAFFTAVFVFCFILSNPFFNFTALAAGEALPDLFTLDSAIKRALEANLDLEVSQAETKAADSARKARVSAFFPSLSATYQYTHNYEERRSAILGLTTPKRGYTFTNTLSQPIFAGFALKNQYDIAKLGLDAAKLNERLVRQSVTFKTKQAYFQLLKAQKLFKVSEQTVKQINAQKEVARNFYEVGMTPLNDLLQAQVELANARQALVVAQNDLAIAEADFNTLLRRPLNAPAALQDILTFAPLTYELEQCFAEAKQHRPEIAVAELEIAIASKNVHLAKKNYYPSVTLQSNYYDLGTRWDVDGGEGISDPHSWDFTAVATWKIWESGVSYHGVKVHLSLLAQARHKKDRLLDDIDLEIKQTYLRTRQAEKNIATVKKAIEQAKENFRINEERYKEQISTSTDVLDAQTLLARTMTNYYNALYDFEISKAALYKAMGRDHP